MAALEPPPSIAKTIRLLQVEFAARYGSKAALKPPVHITLSPPVYLDEEALGQYRSALLEVSKNAGPFGISLRDFSFFKNNRVLFIRVSSSVDGSLAPSMIYAMRRVIGRSPQCRLACAGAIGR